ncbi:MAG TPA: hypothetical protein VKV18_02810 [Chthonomonas sp.]|nr:hypothetical protein [Chthonomonas sp.]HLI47611.1 hypothetical protein [Chthonomonas sp.]
MTVFHLIFGSKWQPYRQFFKADALRLSGLIHFLNPYLSGRCCAVC